MQVIDHQPHAWFLLKDESGLLLDVECHHSAVSCSVLIRLNEEELAEYRRDGHAYLDRLAQAIHYSAPILAISNCSGLLIPDTDLGENPRHGRGV